MALPVTHEGGPLCPQFPTRGFPYTGIAEPQGQTVIVPFRLRPLGFKQAAFKVLSPFQQRYSDPGE